MALLSQTLATGLLIWFALLMVVIGAKIARGDIRYTGFLRHRPDSAEPPDPERVISVIAFPFVLGMYAIAALQADMTVLGPGGRPSMPDVPEYLMVLLAGGNTLYLAGKFMRRS